MKLLQEDKFSGTIILNPKNVEVYRDNSGAGWFKIEMRYVIRHKSGCCNYITLGGLASGNWTTTKGVRIITSGDLFKVEVTPEWYKEKIIGGIRLG